MLSVAISFDRAGSSRCGRTRRSRRSDGSQDGADHDERVVRMAAALSRRRSAQGPVPALAVERPSRPTSRVQHRADDAQRVGPRIDSGSPARATGG